MAELKRELTWSFSRDRMFNDCRRAYYYQYYASWGGWDRNADEFSRKAYLLKNISTIDIWIGETIHQVIAWVLSHKKEGIDIPFKQANEQALKELKRTWKQSIKKAWQVKIKSNLNLYEHYYNEQPDDAEMKKKMAKAAKCIRNFYSCGLLDDISLKKIISVDQFDSFICDGIKIFAIPDLAVSNGRYTLYDWKTGKLSEKDVLQLSFYVLYAMHKWGLSEEKVNIVPVYLAEEEVSLEPVAKKTVAAMKEYMLTSFDSMKSVLSSIDENIADFDSCYKTDETWRCVRCKFKEICR